MARKQNSAGALRSAGDDGDGRVLAAATAGGAVAAPAGHTAKSGGGGAAGSGAPHEGALQEVELQDRLRRLLEQPAVRGQPDERAHRRRQEHRLRAGREDGRQPQRACRCRQRQDAPQRGHRRVRRLPGARELPAGDREAPEVGEGSGGHRRRGDASRIPAGRARAVRDREERRHLHGEAGEEAVPGPDPVLPRRCRADLGAAVLARYKGAVAGIKTGLPEHPVRSHHPGEDRGRGDDRLQRRPSRRSRRCLRRRRPDAGRERRGPRRHVQGRPGPARRQLPGELVRRRLVRAEARSAPTRSTTSARGTSIRRAGARCCSR